MTRIRKLYGKHPYVPTEIFNTHTFTLYQLMHMIGDEKIQCSVLFRSAKWKKGKCWWNANIIYFFLVATNVSRSIDKINKSASSIQFDTRNPCAHIYIHIWSFIHKICHITHRVREKWYFCEILPIDGYVLIVHACV